MKTLQCQVGQEVLHILRYIDPKNDGEFCAKDLSDYWGQVDYTLVEVDVQQVTVVL